MKKSCLFLFLFSWCCLWGEAFGYPEKDYWEDELYLMLNEEWAARCIDGSGTVLPERFAAVFATTYAGSELLSVTVPFFRTKDPALRRVLRIRFTRAVDVPQMVRAFSARPSVVYAEPVPKVRVTDTVAVYEPDDLGRDALSGQWYLYQINAPQAWAVARGERSVRIAIVDDALDIGHPDLAGNLWVNPGEIPGNGIDDDGNGYIDDIHGYDVGEDKPDPSVPNPQRNHGTHVAGLAGASTNNGQGIASIGFNLSLIGVKCVRDSSTSRNLRFAYEGLVYAIAAGADIINCSWGSSSESFTNARIVRYAIEQGCIVVAAAGNEGTEERMYPAAYPDVLSVGNTGQRDVVSGSSSYGAWLSVCAPGTSMRSTLPGSRYGSLSGTSMASPLVAGLLGLMKSVNPGLSPEVLRHIVVVTADSIEQVNAAAYQGKVGSGRINAYRAIQYVDSLKRAGVTDIAEILPGDGLWNTYPNPTRNELVITFTPVVSGPVEGTFVLRDIAGRVAIIRPYSLRDHKEQEKLCLDVSPLSPGVYLLSWYVGGRHYTRKVLIG